MSTFLCRDKTGKSNFEKEISRYGWRSHQLSQVVTDIEVYLRFEDDASYSLYRADDSGDIVTPQTQINRIQKDFDAWRLGNPKEFAARFAPHASDFLKELKTKNADKLDFDLKDEDLGKVDFPEPPITADNPQRGQEGRIEKESHLKKVWEFAREKAPSAYDTGELGYGLVKEGEFYPGPAKVAKWVKTATHVAEAGKVGLGLTAAGMAVQAADSAVAGVSAFKTYKHLIDLWKLRDAKYVCECHSYIRGQGGDLQPVVPTPNDMVVHRLIKDHILPYIIHQKEKKLAKKGATVIALGLAVDLVSASRAGWKWAWGTRGFKRYKAAHWLAYHFCTCDCNLASEIVRALTSDEEALKLLTGYDYESIADCLAEKMKSI